MIRSNWLDADDFADPIGDVTLEHRGWRWTHSLVPPRADTTPWKICGHGLTDQAIFSTAADANRARIDYMIDAMVACYSQLIDSDTEQLSSLAAMRSPGMLDVPTHMIERWYDRLVCHAPIGGGVWFPPKCMLRVVPQSHHCMTCRTGWPAAGRSHDVNGGYATRRSPEARKCLIGMR
jgi:hypothetical protein